MTRLERLAELQSVSRFISDLGDMKRYENRTDRVEIERIIVRSRLQSNCGNIPRVDVIIAQTPRSAHKAQILWCSETRVFVSHFWGIFYCFPKNQRKVCFFLSDFRERERGGRVDLTLRTKPFSLNYFPMMPRRGQRDASIHFNFMKICEKDLIHLFPRHHPL